MCVCVCVLLSRQVCRHVCQLEKVGKGGHAILTNFLYQIPENPLHYDYP